MPTEICLTLQTLSQKIDRLLEDYPENFYDLVLNLPQVRQQLFTRVLSQLPHCYLSKSPGTICCSLEAEESIDDFIRRSINQTLQQFQQGLRLSVEIEGEPPLSTCIA